MTDTDNYKRGIEAADAAIMDFVKSFAYQAEWAVFHGQPSSSPIADWLSRCCLADTYVEQRDYYAGDPSCSSCRRALGPQDVVRVPRVAGQRRPWLPVTP